MSLRKARIPEGHCGLNAQAQIHLNTDLSPGWPWVSPSSLTPQTTPHPHVGASSPGIPLGLLTYFEGVLLPSPRHSPERAWFWFLFLTTS